MMLKTKVYYNTIQYNNKEGLGEINAERMT